MSLKMRFWFIVYLFLSAVLLINLYKISSRSHFRVPKDPAVRFQEIHISPAGKTRQPENLYGQTNRRGCRRLPIPRTDPNFIRYIHFFAS